LGEIKDKIKRKSKFKSQLRAKLMKLGTKDLSTKNAQIQGINSIENMCEIEQIRSLEIN
jgi:hypothetical protein